MEVSLATPLVSRDGNLTKDAMLMNCYWEDTPQGQKRVVVRPGLQSGAIPAVGQGQGMFSSGVIDYAIIADTVYGLMAWGGVTPAALPAPTTAGLRMYCVSSPNLASGPSRAFIKSSSDAWTYSSGVTGAVKVVSAYPPVTVPGVVYLDSSYYVMDKYGQIFGSAVEDGTSWTSLNVIQCDRGLGRGVAVSRHLNYLVAFCERGLEFFYDAANAAPGSPLAPVPNATSSVGCAHGDSIQTTSEDETIFMSVGPSGAPSISIIRGMSISPLSDASVNRILAANPVAPDYSQLYSMALRVDGRPFYLLTMYDFTLACDLSTGAWAQWTSYSGSPFVDHAFDPGFVLRTRQAPGAGVTPTALLSRTKGQISSLGGGTSNELIHMLIRTRTLDAGGTSRKSISELGLLGDTVNVTMSVRYSNDDCQTWSAQRTIDMSLPRKRLTRLGSFFRRVFEFSCAIQNQVLRIESMVLPDRNLPAQAAPTQE